MNFFEKILDIITYRAASAPKSFGIFHLTLLITTILFAVILPIKFKNSSEKDFRKILLILWCVMLIGEIYHQTAFSFNVENGEAVWRYQWHKFPFQFCATPLYILPLAIFSKKKRIRDSALSFLSCFSLFAGLAVSVYPNDVFTTLVGANIQSLVHHGLQIVIGVMIAVHNRQRLNSKFFLKGVYLFLIITSIAMVMNEIAYGVIQKAQINEAFNMFYISPYYDCSLPVLGDLYHILPYPAFIALYVLGFVCIAALVFYIQKATLLFSHIDKTKTKGMF